MEKLSKTSPDLESMNIEQLKELFPSVVTEGKVDFDKLRLLLGDEIDESNEKYQFTWHGKGNAIRNAQAPSKGTLIPDSGSSKQFDQTGNLYIEGDNLEVLKLLQKTYYGKIKMIYIDPPYNTGNDFVYNDDFKDSLQNYKNQTSQTSRSNPETSGRYHTDWLNMMYPRLVLARNLLSEDGVIFISIDDNEVDNLRKISDEIFGESNFIATIVRNTNSTKNQSLFVSVSHEYCLIYSKNNFALKLKHTENKWSVPKNNFDEYIKKVRDLQKEKLTNEEITSELKRLTNYPRFIDFTNYWYFDNTGLYAKDNLGGVKNGNMVAIKNTLTGNYDPIPPGGFRYDSKKLDLLISENRIHFHTDGSLPRLKRYLHENENQRPKSIMSDDQRPDYSLLKEYQTPFDNPKQISFMTRIVGIADKDSIILDFFSGSATTAHAVMKLNAEDGGKRKFIMVQLPEPTDLDSEAYKAGYENICEIGKERIRRAGEKVKQELMESVKKGESEVDPNQLDIGFKVFKLESTNIKEWDGSSKLTEDLLSMQEEVIKEGRTEQDVLYEVLLKYGVFDQTIETITINKKQMYIVGQGYLLVCLADDITMEDITEIGKRKPHSVIFKESGFKDDNVKMNALYTLERLGVEDIKSL
jgi:adenine-specific DNA-methyltransferase